MPRAIAYSENEGCIWKPLPKGLYITSIAISHMPPESPTRAVVDGRPALQSRFEGLTFHSLLFDDGRIWDSVFEGWRPFEMSPGELEQLKEHLMTLAPT